MISARLQRERSSDEGTPGFFTVHNGPDSILGLRSLELPWHDNERNVSCIEPGCYECYWRYSKKYKRYLYGLKNVPGRSGILIHRGNVAGDKSLGFRTNSAGCILLGESMGELWGQLAVMNSRRMIAAFETFAQHKRFWLDVVEP